MGRRSIGEKYFRPVDSVLRDDALHNSEGFSHIETFYYDAIFENNYSIVSLVNIFKIGRIGVALTGMFIYKDLTLIKSKRERIRFRYVTGSETIPHLTIHDKDIIRVIDPSNKIPTYQISMGDTHDGYTLFFTQNTAAWKGKTELGKWLAIPHFNVQGTLYNDGTEIPVKGGGYHDHNIYPFSTPFFNQGYHFGKFSVEPFDVTWARIIKKHGQEFPIIIVNNGMKYFSIDPKNIIFTINKLKEENKKIIPYSWSLTTNTKDIMLNVTMETVNVHHIGLPLLHYWRSHHRITGTISLDSVSKTIDTWEISEYLKFF